MLQTPIVRDWQIQSPFRKGGFRGIFSKIMLKKQLLLLLTYFENNPLLPPLKGGIVAGKSRFEGGFRAFPELVEGGMS